MKKITIVEILYIISSLCFCFYPATKNSEFMFFGGIFAIIASIMLIITKKNKK